MTMVFHKESKKTSVQAKSIDKLTAIVPAEVLLQAPKRAELLGRTRQKCGLPTPRWESLVQPAIHNLSQSCQHLPFPIYRYYSKKDGWLDYALFRAEAALSLFKEYAIDSEEEPLTDEQQLWEYALFTAALLQGLGRFYSEFQVEVYDAQGHFLKK
ncbi:MAG: TraI domain-containing protein, partial [Legionellaceae bacterium]|nr:TraI domain-containing protein [Legionellaceae bacterium]